LGDVDDNSATELGTKLDRVCSQYGKFTVNVEGIKLIPNEKYVRVIVLTASDVSGVLEKLRSDIVGTVGGDSKPPHITLCRVKNIENKEESVRRIKEIDVSVSGFEVDSVELIKSELGRDGPIYTSIRKYTLG